MSRRSAAASSRALCRIAMPFEPVDHTGDLAFRLWADDLPGVAAEGIRALVALLFEGEPAPHAPLRELAFRARGIDREDALVQCLSEALHAMERASLRPVSVHVELLQADAPELAVRLRCAEADGVSVRRAEEVKGVTYHGVHLRQTSRGLETLIVFDV